MDIKFKTPRDFAKWHLRQNLDAGWSVDSIIRAQGGGGWKGFNYQIGGYAVLTHGYPYNPNEERQSKWESIKLKPYQIAVTEFNGEEKLYVFSVRELCNEIISERVQPKLLNFL